MISCESIWPATQILLLLYCIVNFNVSWRYYWNINWHWNIQDILICSQWLAWIMSIGLWSWKSKHLHLLLNVLFSCLVCYEMLPCSHLMLLNRWTSQYIHTPKDNESGEIWGFVCWSRSNDLFCDMLSSTTGKCMLLLRKSHKGKLAVNQFVKSITSSCMLIHCI